MSVRDEPMQVIVDSDSIRVVSAGETGPASLALGSLIDGPVNSVLRMTADGPVWMPVDETPIVKRLNPITQQMVSPPTVTQGVADAASVIVGGTLLLTNADPTNILTYFGCEGGFTGSYPYDTFYGPRNLRQGGGGGDLHYVTSGWGVEFEYDDDELELYALGQGAGYRLTVDGEGYESRDGHTLAATGSAYYLHYQFDDARPRRLRWDFDPNFVLGGIRRTASGTLSQTTKALGPKVAVLGDSFAEGVDTSHWYTGFGDRLGQYCAWRDVNMSGYGGTGYLADNPGGIYGALTFRDRLQKDIIDAAPDIVIVAGGLNDQGGYVEATFETEADLLFDAIMTGLPDCALIVLGPFWPDGEPVANDIKVRDSIREKSLPYARLFIDNLGGTIPYTGTEADYKDTGWMTGTGYVTNEQHDGNADFYTTTDGTHPTQAGHDYLALRLAEAIALDAPELLG